jgi:hypothetical protein
MATSDKVPVRTVNLDDPENVRYWLDLWQVTEGELRAAVSKAGAEAPAVAFALGREAWTAEARGKVG